MAEIRIKIDKISYANIIKLAFPYIKKRAEGETALWASLIRSINEPDEETIEKLLKLIPDSAKEKLIESVLEKYKDEIPSALNSLASSKGLTLNVTDVEIKL